MNPSKGIPSPDFESGLEIVGLPPGTLVEEVGDTLVLLSSDRSDVVSIPSALATYHPDPEPHLRLREGADRLISQLTRRGFLTAPSSAPPTQLTRRTALRGTTALAGGVAISLSLPLAAAASSVSRRPGFWAIKELTGRSSPIEIYLSVLKPRFPEIVDGLFDGYWNATVDGQRGITWGDETSYYVWFVTLESGTALHKDIADFQAGLRPAPDIPGTISGTTTIDFLFSYDQGIPYPPT